MPVLVGAIAVAGALAVVRLIAGTTEVSVFSINVITLLGMGLAIDYALFVISRFREELAKLPGDPDASAKAITITMRTAGRTVLFSGLTVAAAMSSLLVFPQSFLRSLGYGGMAAVVVAMPAALTVLPAMLGLLGRRVDSGRLPRAWTGALTGAVTGAGTGRRRRQMSVDSDHGPWARVAHSVMRRPVAYLLGFTSAGYLDATQPILMLAILVGLSMDYEVFLLSRVREQWDRTHDNTLLGDWNWWAPGPMRRWWERHGLREDEDA